MFADTIKSLEDYIVSLNEKMQPVRERLEELVEGSDEYWEASETIDDLREDCERAESVLGMFRSVANANVTDAEPKEIVDRIIAYRDWNGYF